MSGGAELIAGAIVKHVAGKLSQTAWERMGGMLWNFKDDVTDMEDKMVTLQVALSYADKRSRVRGNDTDDDALAQHWLKKYKSVAYDIEDAMDELEANATIWKRGPSKVKLCFSSINPLIVRITMSNKMRSIRLQLDKIAEDAKKFDFLPSSMSSTEQDNNEMVGETYVGARDDIQMVGREKEKQHILKLLQNSGDRESSVIPIVGLGGMGKSTIAKFVYTLKETNEFHFDLKAWVHVSMKFKLEKIIADIISQLDGRIPVKDATLHHLKSLLDHILYGKVYLMVLDDLWEERAQTLEELVNMLQSGNKGSKIVVTTRSEKVVSTLSIVGAPYFHIIEPIKLKGLSDDECWSIMRPHNLGDDQIIDFVHLGKEIAKQCNGVPLVAKALGYVMAKKCTIEGWLEIKHTNIMDIKDDDKGILKGLLLSYHHMPPQLKLCFMYCSIFPKRHDIDHDNLIRQWIALGFIHAADGQLLQKIGTEYINDFLGMSFFLNVMTYPTVSSTKTFKPTHSLRMHDMVHDLARHVVGDELSYTDGANNINTERDKLNGNYHLFLNHNQTPSTYMALPTKVRAVRFMECIKLQLPKQAFSHTLYLRVLDLSGCHVSKLPVSIYKLKLLRYLDASTLPISKLPKSLNRLLNLQTLIFSNTSLKSLPANIGCLQKLQYFDLSGCVRLCELPISFGNLSALLFLNLANCHELHTLPESFGKLHRLQFFNLSDCYKLHSLPKSCCQLRDLTHLDLSDCHNLEQLPDCIDQLSKLECLNMTSCSKVQILPDSVCKLMMLKHLDLSFCVKLEHLPSSLGDLRLQSLNVEGCVFLESLPDSIFNMSTLKIVEAELALQVENEVQKLRESLNLQGSSSLDGGSSDLWSQIAQLREGTLFDELNITGLEDVEYLEGAEQSKLSSNSKLTKLFLQWERDEGTLVEHADAAAANAISVLAKLLPPRSLKHLDLCGYMGIDFPRWMLDISSYLPHLTTIYLFGLKECNCLPPFGRLPNLRALGLLEMPNLKKVGKEFYGDYGSCQKLRIIILVSLENLEEWWTTRSSTEGEFLIPNLHMLAAIDCPKLKFMPYPPRSMVWGLANSDRVLPEHGFGNLSSTISPFHLGIRTSSLSSEGWRRAQHLSSIEGLEFSCITGLRNLPDATRCFKSLRKLVIVSCKYLETLPEWLGDLTSLREIHIKECPKLSSLPESIRGLTELKKLRIIDCPELLEKCQGEDKHKIAHIPEVTSE